MSPISKKGSEASIKMAISKSARLGRERTIIGASLCFALAGCGQHGNTPPSTKSQQPQQPAQQQSTPGQATEQPENQTEETKCPDPDDARKAIAEGKKILAEAQDTLRDPKISNFSERVETLQKELSIWQEHNKIITDGCQLLLGADGTSVNPEIPLTIENLTLGREWMQQSMNAAGAGKLDTSRLYLKAAEKAIKQAVKVIDKKVKPNRSTAVVKTPSYLKAAARISHITFSQ